MGLFFLAAPGSNSGDITNFIAGIKSFEMHTTDINKVYHNVDSQLYDEKKLEYCGNDYYCGDAVITDLSAVRMSLANSFMGKFKFHMPDLPQFLNAILLCLRACLALKMFFVLR